MEPGSGAKVEGAQGEHDEEPVLGLACPGGQSRQAAADDDPYLGLYEPAAHGRQAVDEFAPEVLYVPRPHFMHDDDELEPVSGLKVPAAHGVQLGAGWPPGLYDPALHKLHSDAVLARELGLCVPAGQGVESPEPAGQKQPGAQGIGGEDDAGGQ